MVGSAGNAPVVIFQRCFMTAGLQTAGWIISRNGSGSGSCTHLNEFMRLISVHWSSFPRLKWWSPAGNAPA
jgi:hypothetical protein